MVLPELSDDDLLTQAQAAAIPQGGTDSTIYAQEAVLSIPVAPADTIAEPTGVGGAYRAGIY